MRLIDELLKTEADRARPAFSVTLKILAQLIRERARTGHGYISVGVSSRQIGTWLEEWADQEGLEAERHFGVFGRSVLLSWGDVPPFVHSVSAAVLADGTLKLVG